MRYMGGVFTMQMMAGLLVWLSSLLTPTSPAPQQLPAQPTHLGKEARYRRVCYYTNWSQYRKNGGRFLPANIDPFLCTHIVFAFAKVDHKGQLAPYEWNDIQYPYLYRQFTSLKKKNPDLKTLLAVGGWTLGSGPFTSMVKTKEGRRQFTDQALQYLRTHHFDGLDLDWEYPANRGSPPEDKDNFSLLLKELSNGFDKEASRSGKPRLLLAAAVAGGEKIVRTAYDVPKLNKYLDFISLMSYDLHGSWSKYLGHNAPLYGGDFNTGENKITHSVVEQLRWQTEDVDPTNKKDDCVRLWLRLGASRDKLVMGIPSYGRSFTTCKGQVKPGQRNCGVGKPAPYTREKGFVSFYEMESYLDKGWKRVWLDKEKVPYAYNLKTQQWVGYDDLQSIKLKAEYIQKQGLGGAMLWALDLDDFVALESDTVYPLARTIRSVLTDGEEFPEFDPPSVQGKKKKKKKKKPAPKPREDKRPKPTQSSPQPPVHLKRPVKNPKDNVKNLQSNHINIPKASTRSPQNNHINLKDNLKNSQNKHTNNPKGSERNLQNNNVNNLKKETDINKDKKKHLRKDPMKSKNWKDAARLKNPKDYAKILKDISGKLDTKLMSEKVEQTLRQKSGSPLSGLPKTLGGINGATKKPSSGSSTSTSSDVHSEKPALNQKPQAVSPSSVHVKPGIVKEDRSPFRKSVKEDQVEHRTVATTQSVLSIKKAGQLKNPTTAKPKMKSKASESNKATVKPAVNAKSNKKQNLVVNPYLKFKPQFLTSIASSATPKTTENPQQNAGKAALKVTRTTPTKRKTLTKSSSAATSPLPTPKTYPTTLSTITRGSSTTTASATSTPQLTTKSKSVDSKAMTSTVSSPSSTVPSRTRWWQKNLKKAKKTSLTTPRTYDIKDVNSRERYTGESQGQKKHEKAQPAYTLFTSDEKKPQGQVSGETVPIIYKTKSTSNQKSSKTQKDLKAEDVFDKKTKVKSNRNSLPSKLSLVDSSTIFPTSHTTPSAYVISTKVSSTPASSGTSTRTTTLSKSALSTRTPTSSAATESSSSVKTSSKRSKWLFKVLTTSTPTRRTLQGTVTFADSNGKGSKKTTPTVPIQRPLPKPFVEEPTKVHIKSEADMYGKNKNKPKDMKGKALLTKPTTTTTATVVPTTTTTSLLRRSTRTSFPQKPKLTTKIPRTTLTNAVTKSTARTKLSSFNLKSRDSSQESKSLIRDHQAKDIQHDKNSSHDQAAVKKDRHQSQSRKAGSSLEKMPKSQTLHSQDSRKDPRKRKPAQSIFSRMTTETVLDVRSDDRLTTISSPSASSSISITSTTTATITTTTTPPPATTLKITSKQGRPTDRTKWWEKTTKSSEKTKLLDRTSTEASSSSRPLPLQTSTNRSSKDTSTSIPTLLRTTQTTKPTDQGMNFPSKADLRPTPRVPHAATKYQKNRGDLTVQVYKDLLMSSTVDATKKPLLPHTPKLDFVQNKQKETSKTPRSKILTEVKGTDAKETKMKTGTLQKSKFGFISEKDRPRIFNKKITPSAPSLRTITPSPTTRNAAHPPNTSPTRLKISLTYVPPKPGFAEERSSRPHRLLSPTRWFSQDSVDPKLWLDPSEFNTHHPKPPRRQEEDPNIRARSKPPLYLPPKRSQGITQGDGTVVKRVKPHDEFLKIDVRTGVEEEVKWWERDANLKKPNWWKRDQTVEQLVEPFSGKKWWERKQAAEDPVQAFSGKDVSAWEKQIPVSEPPVFQVTDTKTTKDCDKDPKIEQFKATGMQPHRMRAGVEVSYEVKQPSSSPRFETLPAEKMPVQSEYQPEYQPDFSYHLPIYEFQCPTVFGIYSDPMDCQRFYQCVWLVAFHHTCGPGTVWNDEMKICDWPTAGSCLS